MNIQTDADLLNLVAANLQEQIGQSVYISERQAELLDNPKFRLNGRFYIGEAKQSFALEAKKKFTEGMADQLRHLTSHSQEPAALVISYIPDKLGQELQQRGICYPDTAGNTYLRAANTIFLIKGNRQPKTSAQMQHRAS
jgi:hypothetical protein